ncbi:MAG: hypothetical protein ACKOWF_15525 [Chloroflexota bacterium]
MLRPLLTLVAAGGAAWFGYDALRDGALNLPSIPVASIVEEAPVGADPAAPGAVVPEEAVVQEGVPDPGRQFGRALSGASDQARELFKLGERKSRDIPDILNEQQKMGDRLAEIDALVASGSLPPELQPAVDAYSRGAADVREAIENAQAGFSRLDWERVKRATEQMGRGLDSLSEAARLAGN